MIAASVKIGDGNPQHSMDELGDDLAELTHTDAFGHYRISSSACSYTIFADEPYRGKVQGRDAFEHALTDAGVSAEVIAKHLREWDAAKRPVACLHWWEVASAMEGRA